MARQDPSEEINAALTALIGRAESVLDVGCGAGVNGMIARRAGSRVTGIEPNPALAARARNLLEEVLELDPSNSEQVMRALGDRRFDLILMADILGKPKRPAELIASFARFLPPEGRLGVSARNRGVWPRKLGLANEELGL